MVRVLLLLFLFTSILHLSCPFGDFIAQLYNIRCTFSDTILKKPFKFYDELIAPIITSFYYHAANEEPQKMVFINGTYYSDGFNSSKPTRVVIHGYWNSHNSRLNRALKEVYLKNLDVNLIVVNYSRISRDTCYKIARSRLGVLGRRIATFLDTILGKDEWQWRNLALIGHSLGAHASGIVGRSVRNGRVGAIFALDPAGPGFRTSNSENRLRRGDADYIECLHTNGGSLGLMAPICTVDIYPNFGSDQPGCSIFMDLCCHSRAWKYFAESLTTNFTAFKCNSMKEITDEVPCNGTEITMGENDLETKANLTGIFYLSTNDESPFSKG